MSTHLPMRAFGFSRFDAVDVETGFDFVRVFAHRAGDADRLVIELSGPAMPPSDIAIDADSVIIEFVSDASVNSAGFSAVVVEQVP